MCLRAKDHLEGTKVAVFPSLCAPQKDQSGSAADWRPPKSGDQEDDGRPGYPKRSRRPSDGRWWDADEAMREEGPVQAIAVALHDVTGRGSRVMLPGPASSEVQVLLHGVLPRRWLAAHVTDRLLSPWQPRTSRRVLVSDLFRSRRSQS